MVKLSPFALRGKRAYVLFKDVVRVKHDVNKIHWKQHREVRSRVTARVRLLRFPWFVANELHGHPQDASLRALKILSWSRGPFWAPFWGALWATRDSAR